QRVFAGDTRGALTSWRGGWRGFRQDEVFTTHSGPVTCLAVSPDDRLLATAGTDNRVRIWSKLSGIELLAEISSGLRGVVRYLQFSSNGETLTTLTDAGQAARWRTSDGEMEIDWRLTHRVSSSLALTDTGRVVAQGRTDGSVCLYHLPSAGDKSSERRPPSVM